MKNPKKPYFKRGDKTKIANETNIYLSNLCEILARKRHVSHKLAVALSKAAKKFKYDIPTYDWLLNVETKHPAFKKRSNKR